SGGRHDSPLHGHRRGGWMLDERSGQFRLMPLTLPGRGALFPPSELALETGVPLPARTHDCPYTRGGNVGGRKIPGQNFKPAAQLEPGDVNSGNTREPQPAHNALVSASKIDDIPWACGDQ